MAYYVDARGGSTAPDGRSTSKAGPQKLLAGLALAAILSACGWTLYANVFAAPSVDIVVAPNVTVVAARPAPVTQVMEHPIAPKLTWLRAPTFDLTLIDSTRALGTPHPFTQSAPLRAALQRSAPAVRVAESVPLPTPRPAEAGKPSLRAMVQRGKVATASAADSPFDKLFGKPESGPALAYAAPDGGVTHEGRSLTPGRLPANTDGVTAVYDITARTVYMPDGTRLEAHSGLRDKLDDPRFVHVKMHGATPPHTYDLVPRESLFHGVQALRLIPVGGEGEIFGRTGLLAHTYMLGPNGDSNGCVSFRNYDAFLRAYQQGKVKRLVVVASGGRSALAANN